MSGLAPFGKDPGEQAVYLARDFPMDRNSRFFSCVVQAPRFCATGRSAQIFSLIATNCSLNF